MNDLVGDAWHLSPSAQEALRLRAVAALVAGRGRENVAAVFGVSLKAGDTWWANWQAGGREALVAEQGAAGVRAGPGSPRAVGRAGGRRPAGTARRGRRSRG
ncbi:helix-turn-helix domain-containing protein [Streptomyces microflavus]|uniref:helix-turn-helix domain-containing protein n=1 Tax=Streptomyces microflavus TaxID=1919 RepID=UPI0037D4BEBF